MSIKAASRELLLARMQAHIGKVAGRYRGKLKSFVALGLKVNFTELDINIYNHNDKDVLYQNAATQEVLEQQAARYASIFALFHQYRQHIERVTFWGPADKYSWLNHFPKNRTNHPLLFDRAGQPKPAFWAVVGAAHKKHPDPPPQVPPL